MSRSLAGGTICETCGSRIETTASGDLGCLACLLRAGLDASEDEQNFEEIAFDSLGGYEITRRADGTRWELGRGAMGVTYRALDRSLQRAVALKVVHSNLATRSAGARERFVREARMAAALRHPNVATVYHFGIHEQSGQCFCAMELVEGETLQDRVRRIGPLPAREVLEIARQITAALAAAAKCGLVHRDLKPANVMLVAASDESSDLTVKVIDFGVAKALEAAPGVRELTHGGFIGTPAFASPEQFTDAPVDVRSDIYSLGATLWYLLTGHMPFGDRARAAPPPVEQLKAANVPSRFLSLLVSMLATEPSARPSVAELGRQIQIIQERLGGRRKLLASWGAAAGLLVIFATVAGIFFQPASKFDQAPQTIAVLPFTDSSGNKVNTYITSGMQEEILSHLQKISGLVALSSQTIAQAGDKVKDPRELRRTLGATHVLGGKVQPAGERLVVSTQLVDTRTSKPVWTKTFESEIAGFSAVQKSIAEGVAAKLKGNLTSAEKNAIEQGRVHDLQAYELYLQARSLLRYFGNPGSGIDFTRPKAIELLEQAIARDPKFGLAYALLSEAQAETKWAEDTTAEQMAKAKTTAEIAVRVAPQVPEGHLVLGSFYYPLPFEKGTGAYNYFKDKERGLEEWKIAERLAPNNATVLAKLALAAIDRGAWNEAFQKLERTRQVEPLEPIWAQELGDLYLAFRHYDEAERIADGTIAKLAEANPPELWSLKRRIALARGDTAAAALANEKSNMIKRGFGNIYGYMAEVGMMQHHYAEAVEILETFREKAAKTVKNPGAIKNLNPFAIGHTNLRLGIARRAQGEKEKALAAFVASEQGFREWLRHYPEEPSALAMLTMAVAGQGRRDDTLREIAKALETFPLSRDPLRAVEIRQEVANAYAWTGDRVLALDLLEEIVHLPGGPTAGDLKLNPSWDDLREDPRFEQLIAEAAAPISL